MDRAKDPVRQAPHIPILLLLADGKPEPTPLRFLPGNYLAAVFSRCKILLPASSLHPLQDNHHRPDARNTFVSMAHGINKHNHESRLMYQDKHSEYLS